MRLAKLTELEFNLNIGNSEQLEALIEEHVKIESEILCLCNEQQTVKDNLEILIEHAWLDVFGQIVKLNRNYFYEVFSRAKRKQIKRNVVEVLTELAISLDSFLEDDVLACADLLWLSVDRPLATEVRHAQNLYLALKEAQPFLAADVMIHIEDNFKMRKFKEQKKDEKDLVEIFKKLKVNYNRLSIVVFLSSKMIFSNDGILTHQINLANEMALIKLMEVVLKEGNKFLIKEIGHNLGAHYFHCDTTGQSFTEKRYAEVLEGNIEKPYAKEFLSLLNNRSSGNAETLVKIPKQNSFN